MNLVSKNLEETRGTAYDFASRLKPKETMATIVGLYGELGAGKTTFMKYLAEALGIKEIIQSPTFVIMKSFNLSFSQSFNTLIHIDAYRIESTKEMINLGWNEIIADPKNLICIEWPERIAEIMPPHIVLKFEHVSETERKIILNTNL